MTSKDYTFRIITFNLLSPAFATPSHYHYSPPEQLDAKYRLDRISKLLHKWTKANFIICLQEVSEQWNNELIKIFDECCYTYSYNIYADGKMGVAIAFPSAHYIKVESDVYRCGELIGKVCNSMNKTELRETLPSIDEIESDLISASEKDNTSITLLLKCLYFGKNIGKFLIVSTYHMPCRYTKKHFMVAHIHSLKAHVAELQNKWSQVNPDKHSIINSVVIAGDFNITPNSAEYKYMTGEPYTEKELSECKSNSNSLQFYVDMCQIYKSVGFDFNNTIQTLSTYRAINNNEPPYTNVMLQKEHRFINTLDYILITPNIKIMSCIVGLSCLTTPIASYPNVWCPSDHLPLSASLILRNL